MDRRKFIADSAIVAASLGLQGIVAPELGAAVKPRRRAVPAISQTALAPLGDIRALYIMLGHNMWCDWPTELMGEDLAKASGFLPEIRRPDLYLKCNDDIWRKVTDHAAAKGINLLVVDLGEGLFYPSHPELAVEGTWSVEKMQKEIERLNSLGMEVVPKLNFSTTHNGWMKDYRHMISSQPYYRMCEDVIADVVEIFGHPRFFHIGYDEENERHQAIFNYCIYRKGESWWKDFLHIVSTVESHGARPWMWSDYGWDHPDFFERCPKSVIQQNWYYDEQYGGFDPATNTTSDYKRLVEFEALDKAGFDQVPCGTNWSGIVRRRLKTGADDVIGKLVDYGRRTISKERLQGFMMAPWVRCETQEHLEIQLKGIDLFSDALKNDRI